jgi:hypothetical protein
MQQRPPRQRLSSNALLLTNAINSRLVGYPEVAGVAPRKSDPHIASATSRWT